MSTTKNLANLASVLDDGTSGQVLQSTGSGGVQFADSTGSGVTVHANQAAMLTDAASASEGTLHYETDNNKLYVKQSSGFYLLASITNVAPTIDSFSENTGGAGANNLTSGGTFTLTAGSNTVVTINATEPDLETISYSATVTSGTATDVFSSPSFPVTNQSSNVFTLTPVTSGSGGTVTIRFDASDGTNVANVSHSFEIAFIIADSHFTSLLMATDGLAGDNNDITDSSSSSHTITVNGDAHAGTFSPYRHGGYSVEFNGSSDWLTGPTSLLNLTIANASSQAATIEAWVYHKGRTSPANSYHNQAIIGKGDVYLNMGLNGSGNVTFYHYDGTARTFTSTGTVPLNTWTHVAATISGGTVTLYINGSADATTGTWYGIASAGQNQAVTLGRASTNASSNYFNGYISDLRVIEGTATAPASGGPTERLTAVTNTSLLTCHLPYIADTPPSGGTAKTITVNGDPETKPIGPYDYEQYSESTNGGSVYFDGTDDRLSITHSTELQLGTTSAFTAEFWVYIPATNADYSVLLGKGVNSGTAEWHLELMADEKIDLFISNNGTSYTAYTVTDVLNHNTWYHIALVRENTSTIKVYTNGVQSYSNTSFSDWNIGTGIAHVGGYGEGSTTTFSSNTYLTDVRIVKGTAVYTGNFTPPSGPLTTTGGTYPSTTNVDTSITASNTKLLLKGTDAHVLDKSQSSNLKLVGTAASTSALTSGSTPPYIGAAWAYTSAVSFDGDSDYVIMPQIPLGSGDFTIEAYTYLDARLTTFPAIFSNYNSFSAGALALFAGHNTKTITNYQVAHNGAGFASIDGGPITYDQWVHLCVERYNGTITLYKDGSSVGSFASTATLNGVGSNFYIGTTGDTLSSSYINGWIQDFRVTVGKARYQGAFTKPAAPLKG